MTILALDTSTEICSVALLQKGGDTPKEINRQIKAGHSGMLLTLVDELLESCACERKAIDHIAIGRGPGSFTGMRIGVATAKGLALALGCPLTGIGTLDVIVQAALPAQTQIMPVMDARKGEIFCACYDKDGTALDAPMNLTPEQLADRIKEPTLFIGTALGLYTEALQELLGQNFTKGPQELWHPRAATIALLRKNRPELFSQEVIPLYVRASDATLLLNKTASA